MIKAYKLYTGADGHSHVEAGYVLEEQFHEAKQIRFKETPPYFVYDWHNAPRVQYVLSLEGTLEFEMKTGETFILKPGEVLIAMDTTGSAHRWKMIDDKPWKRVYVSVDESSEINFRPAIDTQIA